MGNTAQTNWDEEVDKLYAEIDRLSSKESKSKTAINSSAKVALNIMYAVIVFVLLAVLLVVQVAKTNDEVPSAFGLTLFYVQTGSMEPTFEVGSVVLAKSVKNTAILSAGKTGVKDGDIVAFYDTEGKKITHRIESVVTLEDGTIAYKTRGDSKYNSTDDEILTQDRIIAVVVCKLFKTQI